MYFTSENCKQTKVLPVIAVQITNDVSNKNMAVTEVIKVMLPNSIGWEGMDKDNETLLQARRDGKLSQPREKEKAFQWDGMIHHHARQ
jgi:hypothetical protein